ncbi:MAG: hypothetical protein I8H76_07450 [Burkholderiales bacterium]|nr:hypothetical protein [Burkholderiales bacterium]MBH2017936.1 hypothetical protein [Burkholderiales bacterium]
MLASAHGERTDPTDPTDHVKPGFTQRWRWWVVCLILLVAVGGVDGLSGHEVSVFLLYALPVGVATRRLGASAGVVVSSLATLVWIVADVASGHEYSAAWILPVNAANRLFCFLLVVAAIRYVDARRDALDARLRAFSGEVPVCTTCDRIQGPDAHWRRFTEHLTEYGQARLDHKACADCARRTYARAGYREAS